MNSINKIGKIQENLLAWFEINQRNFPWRKSKNPYHILVSEKLLQQTIAREIVVIAYEAIITQYPNIESLASAPIENLEQIIKPLGLNYRANEIKNLAQIIMQKHGGEIPSKFNVLMELPGIGDYSARALLSFVFFEDVPIVDTNVARFLYRLFGLPGNPPLNPARNKKLRSLAEDLIPKGKSRDFNLAVLDLCGLICLLRSPKCNICPLQELCVFGKSFI